MRADARPERPARRKAQMAAYFKHVVATLARNPYLEDSMALQQLQRSNRLPFPDTV